MKKYMLACLIVSAAIMTGCSKNHDDVKNVTRPSDSEIMASRAILENRKNYAKDIALATNECVKNITHVTTLSLEKSEIDFKDIVSECGKQAQTTYGAYTEWSESWLQTTSQLKLAGDENGVKN